MAVTDPIPACVDAAGKAGLLALVDHATGAGWSVQAACELLQISRRRVERWQQRRTELADRRPGGVAVNSLLGDEIVQILAMFDEWGNGTAPTAGSRIGAPTWAGSGRPHRPSDGCCSSLTSTSGRYHDPPRANGDRSPTGRPTSRTRSGSTTRPTSPGAGRRC